MVSKSSQLNLWSIFGNFKSAKMLSPNPSARRLLTDGGLSALVADGFMRDETDELIADTYEHLNSHLLTIILSETGLAVAFIASNMLAKAMYLRGIMINPNYQGRGLGNVLINENMNILGAKDLSLHTQNANMDILANRNAVYIHQSALGKASDFGTADPVVEIIEGRERVVHKGKYGKESLYGDMNRYLQQNMALVGLDYQAGDALFFYGTRSK